jgi:hypothetical protein
MARGVKMFGNGRENPRKSFPYDFYFWQTDLHSTDLERKLKGLSNGTTEEKNLRASSLSVGISADFYYFLSTLDLAGQSL